MINVEHLSHFGGALKELRWRARLKQVEVCRAMADAVRVRPTALRATVQLTLSTPRVIRPAPRMTINISATPCRLSWIFNIGPPGVADLDRFDAMNKNEILC